MKSQDDKKRGREASKERVTVKVLARKGEAVLAEWVCEIAGNTDWVRGYIPASQVDADNTVAVDDLMAAAPYSVDWEGIIGPLVITEYDIARELRRAGIWTEDDLRARPREAEAAFRRACHIGVADILARIKH